MMYDKVETTGLSDEAVVAALFNASRPFGMGAYEYKARTMDEAEARNVINEHKASPFGQRGDTRNFYLDYVEGRCIKCQFLHEGNRTYVESDLHDRDYGNGATQAVITALYAEKTPHNNAVETHADAHVFVPDEPPTPVYKPDVEKTEDTPVTHEENAEGDAIPSALPVDDGAFKVTNDKMKEREEQFKVHDGKNRDGDIMQFFRRRNG